MSEIKRYVDDENKPTYTYEPVLESIAEQILKGNCLFFLGAGASYDSKRKSLPTAKVLSRDMAHKCGLEWHDYIPLSTIAFYYEFVRGRKKLNAYLKECIHDEKIEPSRTIEYLIDIICILEEKKEQTFVITTNYDTHFERAYERVTKRKPEVITYTGGQDFNKSNIELHTGLNASTSDWFQTELTTLYKIHGCISDSTDRNLIITEEDYVNFVTNALSQDERKRLLRHALARIQNSTILFVGYSLTDWNFRVIFKATTEGKESESYALQKHIASDGVPTLEQARWESSVKFWDDRNVDIINAEGTDFMADLLGVVRSMVGDTAR